MRNYSMHDLIWKNRGHELDLYAKKILDGNTQFILVGSQKEKEELKKRTGYELTILEDEVFCNIRDIEKRSNVCIICLSKDRATYDSCKKEFEEAGMKENDRFFQGEVFQMIYDVYKRGQIKIDRIEIFMTSHCTLKCEKCISYIPYFKYGVVVPLDRLLKDIDLLFSKVDYVFKLKLLGGEGFLYPDLPMYVDYIYNNYHDRIGSIRIGTNGTIYPSEEIIQMCKRDKVIIDISDYRVTVPGLSKLEAVKEKLESNSITVDIKRSGEQWLDMGFPNNKPDIKGEEALREHFEKCAMFCRQFADGKLFYCCSNCAAVKAGLYELNKMDYFDFSENFNKKELLEYELGFSELGHTSFCSVCQGGSEEANPYHVEVAKQVYTGGII